MQANQIAMFTLHYRNIPVTFTPTDPQALASAFPALAAAIDTALAAGWTAGADREGGAPNDGKERKTVTVNGWVLGESNKKGIPLVWLYSDHHPYLVHKVTQVYNERIAELPIAIPDGMEPRAGSVAPEKDKAKQRGWFNACAPFQIELVDTGETYQDHPVFKFERVLIKPAPAVAPTQSAPAASANGQTDGPAIDEKALLLVAYERLGVEVFGANDWPKISRERALTASGRKTQNVADLTVGQLQAMLKALQSNQAARAAKEKITPPPSVGK